MKRYILPVLLGVCFCGCAHYAELKDELPLTSLSGNQTHATTLTETAGIPAPKTKNKDDFIEVDDEKGLRKAWPMLLFIALLAAACGAL